jgi:fibronectin type 3 domain-containing protein
MPAVAPAKPATPGFRIFRRDPVASYEAPMNPVPITTNAFEDRTAGAGSRWCYAVRAAASVDPVVESDASNEVCVDIEDVAPPAPPAGVATLAGADSVEVSWSPSAEPDLAGYRVYRAPEGGAAARVAELPPGQTTWRDATPGRGTLHLYTVTAFDQSGNESAPSRPAEGHLP